MTFDDFTSLGAPVPPGLAEAIGYPGDARFVAVYWTSLGDEVVYDDGRVSGTGNSYLFLAWKRHPAVALHLAPYDLGSSEEEGVDALLVDREVGRLSVGQRASVLAFVREQHPPRPELTPWEREEATRAVAELFVCGWREVTVDPAQVERAIREERSLLARMLAFLDQHPPGAG
jgi:hypothetical protein